VSKTNPGKGVALTVGVLSEAGRDRVALIIDGDSNAFGLLPQEARLIAQQLTAWADLIDMTKPE
jgi:hypothetical protein